MLWLYIHVVFNVSLECILVLGLTNTAVINVTRELPQGPGHAY